MIGPTGRVIYVGKAKRLRDRLLSYFRSQYPVDKQARILSAATEIEWDEMPSEFAALLGELRQIQRFRPIFNVRMNRRRRTAFIKISSGPAPKVYVGNTPRLDGTWHYGPFTGVGRLKESVRTLNDLLRLRDCALGSSMTFAEQGDLFRPEQHARCLRHEFQHCLGPCAGLVTEEEYRAKVHAAVAFLEVRSIHPLDLVLEAMSAASERRDFELAAWWRSKFEDLEWLLAASTRARAALAALSFVYRDPGVYGDDRVYVVNHATIKAIAPAPHTPIEREAFRALVTQHADWKPGPGAIPAESLDEMLLLLHWFRRRPGALARTVSFEEWLGRDRPSDAQLRSSISKVPC
jgi:excinuclease ABC subunit C